MTRAAPAPSTTAGAGTEPGRKVPKRALIDTDPGLDDLLALALALASPELEVAGVTTVAGNAPIEIVTDNLLRFRSLADARFPIGAGAAGPLALTPGDAVSFHGEDGRGGVPMPVADPPGTDLVATALFDQTLAQAERTEIIALGPLTNLATVLSARSADPIEAEVVWMGGTLSAGNMTPLAEFNCWADPAAVAVLLESKLPVRMIGLEVTSKIVIRERDLGPHPFGRGRRARFLEDVLSALMRAERPQLGENAAILHDPAAILATTDPDLFRYEDYELRVQVQEGPERGRLLRSQSAEPGHVRYAVEVEAGATTQLFLERLRAWAAACEDPN